MACVGVYVYGGKKIVRMPCATLPNFCSRRAMEEMTRRADFISKRRDAGLDTFSVSRPSPRRPEDVPGFALPNQHVALVAMGTEASPPCPVDAEAPTLCVYGVFASVEEAKEHSDLLSAADPTCSLYAVPCREWVLMPRLSSGSDEAALEARRDALVEAHARAVQEQRAFDARREAFKATGRDDAPRSFAPARDPSDESSGRRRSSCTPSSNGRASRRRAGSGTCASA